MSQFSSFLTPNNIVVRAHHTAFIMSANDHSGCAHICAVVDAAVNVGVQISEPLILIFGFFLHYAVPSGFSLVFS